MLGPRGLAVLERASRALGFEGGRGLASAYERLSVSWWHRSMRDRVRSIHTSDGSPLELSVPLSAAPSELRFTVEPQRAPFGHRANYDASREALASLRGLPGVSLATVEDLLDVFAPREQDDRFGFAMWLGAVVTPKSDTPAYKLYFNSSFLRANSSSWFDVLASRAGTKALTAVRDALGSHGDVGIVSFDLVDEAAARVKLYVGQGLPSPTSNGRVDVPLVERLEALGSRAVAGDARELLETMAPELFVLDNRRAIFVGTTIHVIGGEIERVTTNVNFLPFGSAPPPSEEMVLDRIATLLEPEAARTLGTFMGAVRSGLPSEARALTYVSVQRQDGEKRYTCYASPNLYELQSGD